MELSRRQFVKGVGLILLEQALPDPTNPIYLPWITGGTKKEDDDGNETVPPIEELRDLSAAAESLYPFLSPTIRRRLFSSQRAQVVGVRNWDNTGGIPKAATATDSVEASAAQMIDTLNAASAVGANKPHYYLDSEGQVQEVLPEELEVNGEKKVVRKVAGMPGAAELSSMQFTLFPQEQEFPEGFSFFIRSASGGVLEVPLREFFKNENGISAPSPFIDAPENAQDAKSFIANVPIISADGMDIYLSDNFFTDDRHFWYNFQMSERTPSEVEAIIQSTDLFGEMSDLEQEARRNQDYSQLFADMLVAHHGEEKVGKRTDTKEHTGNSALTLEEGKTASSFGFVIHSGEEYHLANSQVVLEFEDGEEQQFPAAQFFMMDSARKNHANVFFQTAAYNGDESKRMFSLNVPMAGVKKVSLQGPDNFRYNSQITTVNTEVLPDYLRDKRIHMDVDTYKTTGGGDDMKLSSPDMDVVCSTVHLDGMRRRNEWPHYYMEQGQSYYRKVQQADGTTRYMQDGSWSGGEDPWGAFYDGYHPINGGMIQLEEEYLGMDMYRNKGTYWLGLPFEQNTLGVIPDTGADHHFLELNFFMGRRRYEGLEGRIVKIGYRENAPLAPKDQPLFAGDHYLAYEVDENIKAQAGGQIYAQMAQRILDIEQSLVTRENPNNVHKPISVPGFWRTIQALVEYYRYIKGTSQDQNGEVADLIYRDFTANSRLVLRQTNYGESGSDRSEVATFFQQENETAAMLVLLNTFAHKLGLN